MDSRTGKLIRKGRLFNQASGKTLIVAYSHGVLMGPRVGMRTLAEMRAVVEAVSSADGLMVTPGMLNYLETAFIGKQRPALVLHLDYQSFSRSILPYSQGATVELAQIEDALAAGADAVMTYLYMGYDNPEREKIEIERNARLARACERWGMLLMIEPRSAREATHTEDKVDADILAMYCRIAAEIGADMVKCIDPGNGEALTQIVSGCPAPLLLAGGSKTDDPKLADDRARRAMEAGAAGLVFGRNIYEAENPTQTLARFQQIVHGEQ
jgi:class I fructose-bisphosphate aldolase